MKMNTNYPGSASSALLGEKTYCRDYCFPCRNRETEILEATQLTYCIIAQSIRSLVLLNVRNCIISKHLRSLSVILQNEFCLFELLNRTKQKGDKFF